MNDNKVVEYNMKGEVALKELLCGVKCRYEKLDGKYIYYDEKEDSLMVAYHNMEDVKIPLINILMIFKQKWAVYKE